MNTFVTRTSAALAVLICGLGIQGCQSNNPNSQSLSEQGSLVHPEIWPEVHSSVPKKANIENRISSILDKMTLEEKVGQILQPEISQITPEQAQKFHIGSVLNGGGSFPYGKMRSNASDWVRLADAFYHASTDTSDGFQGIPIIWGSDAVHGHNNAYGATIFPHNIGLGAAHNPKLIREIGEVTAKEVLTTGLDWTFAPTLAVVRDDRWGRTYESYAENPELVARYATEVVHGIQGVYGQENFMDASHLLANAKHYLGDGGTDQGVDQGDNLASEKQLRDIHSPGYVAALEAGAQIVMASFSSWQGKKLHAHKGLLTDVLKERMNFDGFVISDWNAHGQIPGCSLDSCAAAINAGVDMIMVTEEWEGFYYNTVKDVKNGKITMARLNDAVRRILRVKARSGLLDKPRPSARPYAGDDSVLGAPEHRAVARQAVRESLVLLKNNASLLPLNPKANILVLGDGANNIGKQSGGWTLSWQGTGTTNADFPNGESIYSGIQQTVGAAGGTVELMKGTKLNYKKRPDVAIVVFGEEPYAEFQGDRATLQYQDTQNTDLKTLKELNKRGIPVVSVFLSGRPLWINEYLNLSQSFVAAWLPGSEGGGVADVLFSDTKGKAKHDFKGKLTFSWPKTAVQFHLNSGTKDYDPLFPVGYGLDYRSKKQIALLPEESGLNNFDEGNSLNFFADGRTVTPWRFFIQDESQVLTMVAGTEIRSRNNALVSRLADRKKQGDSRKFSWQGKEAGKLYLRSGGNQNFSEFADDGFALSLDVRIHQKPTDEVFFTLGCGDQCGAKLAIADQLKQLPDNEWSKLQIPLACFAKAGTQMDRIVDVMQLTTKGDFSLTVSQVRLESTENKDCPGAL